MQKKLCKKHTEYLLNASKTVNIYIREHKKIDNLISIIYKMHIKKIKKCAKSKLKYLANMLK
jgi:hypothetical protein